MSNVPAARIRRLDPHVVNQIAAGEVVHRPANIVKELIENSVDAGARSVSVEIAEGGKRLIRVGDDGGGISPDDLPLAIERHATSKIASADDLHAVVSFGFRGEALASIASVADLTVTTRRAGDDGGWMLRCAYGRAEPVRPVGRGGGTTIAAERIFAEIPARLKFLKSDNSEWNEIRRVVLSHALAQPSIRFSLEHNGRQIFDLVATGGVDARMREALGDGFGDRTIEFDVEGPVFSLRVVAAEPRLHTARRDGIYMYVNDRWVTDPLLQNAIVRAMRTFIPSDRYPRIALFLTIDPQWVDVNVHPAKTEVRFRESRLVADFVYKSIVAEMDRATRGALGFDVAPMQGGAATRIGTGIAEPSGATYRPTGGGGGYGGFRPSASVSGTGGYMGRPTAAPFGGRPTAEMPSVPSQATMVEDEGFRYIGAIAAKYLIVERAGGLEIVDQHAAHERVYYGRFHEALTASSTAASRQQMLVPLTVELNDIRRGALERNAERLSRMGFGLSANDATGQIDIGAVPAWFQGDIQRLVVELLDELGTLGDAVDWNDRASMAAASMACRSAVKAHARLSEAEAVSLIRQLDRTENAISCPHGRPTRVWMDETQLDRLFQRIQ